MVKQYICALIIAFVATGACASQRSYAAKSEFKRLQPCPATGQKRGPCPGWQIDHANPLKCGGADHHSNMQWLTVDQHKEKTAKEARWCRR